MKKNKKRLKIGYVVDDGIDRPDGVQQYILTVGAWMRGQGHDIHYLVGETKRSDIDNVYSLSKNLAVSFNGNKLSSPYPASIKQITRVLKELELDILHVQVPYSPLMAGRVVKLASNRTVVIGTFHILPYSFPTKIGNKLLGLILRRNLQRFDAHLAVSAPAQKFARESFKIESVVIPNAVDTTIFHSHKSSRSSDAQSIKIVFLGRLVARKGCMELLHAIDRLIERGVSNLDVIICGDGPDRNALENYVRKRDLGSYIEFKGFIAEDEKSRYLSLANIAVFPSTAGESFGIVLIEAMASGAQTVVGGDNPGYRSVLEDDQTLFNPRNTRQFADKLQLLVNDASLRERLHNKQQKIVKRYDITTVGQEIENIYFEELSKRERRH